MKKDYTYAVARIRSRELSLLSRQDIDNLINSKSYDDCLQYLYDKGFGTEEQETDVSALLSCEREKIWSLMAELTDDLSPFDVFRYSDDFHNLKVSVKAVTRDVNPFGMLMQNGTVSGEKIYDAIKAHSYKDLPDHLQQTAQQAMTTLLQTGDGQLCDVIIDTACLKAIYKKASETNSDVIKLYAELTVASADIKTAVRCEKTGKSLDFILDALAPCNSVNITLLAKAAAKSLDDIFNYLSTTSYASAVDALKASPSAFEKWCDDKLIDSIKPQKSEPFTIGPLAAYIIARENEIKAVRLILSAKLNDLDSNAVNERLRDMYV
ncbi:MULTISPECIES: V-type ATPase subunit [unclassified Ruminococcus]|uniref:V-type ATPase subunit n=1 Tax=unclassified Ruminococcus TaxID=2608920 RepID=UPI00210D90D8|nr:MULTISPECIES: V-type ATPase subunit [unclassified Ruminococcus]MCQ4022637.1 V-type ATP synthase subunit C [Ruminococcus sp. zg-924]MCQ4114877.1 V-type ATP synthase subunit C [Ruminococcus sp. zg-921]